MTAEVRHTRENSKNIHRRDIVHLAVSCQLINY